MSGNLKRPLVTFALFAYNQEKFIHDAIEAALGQDYSPLEIIISDDRSDDSTYEQMSKSIAGYQGTHSITLRRSDENRGVFAHVLDVVRIAKGELIVFAAGDDISAPERVRILVDSWLTGGAWGLHSNYDKIDDKGNILELGIRNEELTRPSFELRRYFDISEKDIEIVHGATSAYDSRAFAGIDPERPGFILAEDGMLSLLLNLSKRKISHVNSSLVRYRAHDESLTNAPASSRDSFHSLLAAEKKASVYALSSLNRAKYFLERARASEGFDYRKIDIAYVHADMNLQDFKSSWLVSAFPKRFALLKKTRRYDDISYMMPRILGFRFFYWFRTIRNVVTRARRSGLQQ